MELMFVCRDLRGWLWFVETQMSGWYLFTFSAQQGSLVRSGTWKKRHFVKEHEIYPPITIRRNLCDVHIVTGCCDTVSIMWGIGNTRAWKTFPSNPKLLNNRVIGELTGDTAAEVESFVCPLYLSNSQVTMLRRKWAGYSRKGWWNWKRFHLNMIPSRKTSWERENTTKHCSGEQLVIPSPQRPLVTNSGWCVKDKELNPVFTTTHPVPAEYPPLLFYKCNNCSTSRWKCHSQGLKCTGSCSCPDKAYYIPYNPRVQHDEWRDLVTICVQKTIYH